MGGSNSVDSKSAQRLKNIKYVGTLTEGQVWKFESATGNMIPGDDNSTTNLSEGTVTTTAVDVNSDTGNNATIAAASASRAGVQTKANFDAVALNTAKVSADGSVTTHSDVTNAGSGAIITVGERSTLGSAEQTANKGAVNGYASLDGNAKIPSAQLPTKMMEFEGDWNATTNTPALTNTDVDKKGSVYKVTVAGTVDFGAGNVIFKVGDWCYNNGTVWGLQENQDLVSSVNTKTGVVVLDADDISDAATTNKFVTAGDVTVLGNTSGTNTGDQVIPVDSVNTQTGVVVLDADDISDAATTNKFVTAGDITVLGNTSGTNSGDEANSSTTVIGIIELGTQTEVNTGTDAVRAVTPDTLEDKTMGTYTGTTITDNVVLKAALQELETAVESGGGDTIFTGGTMDALSTIIMAGFGLSFNGGLTTFKGAGATSGTTALLVENSASTDLFKINDVGEITAGGGVGYLSGVGRASLTVRSTSTGADRPTFALLDGFDKELFVVSTSGIAIGTTLSAGVAFKLRANPVGGNATLSPMDVKDSNDVTSFVQYTDNTKGGTITQIGYYNMGGAGRVPSAWLNIKGGTANGAAFGMQNGVDPTGTALVSRRMWYATSQFKFTTGSVATPDIIKLYKETALTASLTSTTQAGTFTPDYAIQAVTNTSPFGFVSADEAETLISTVINLQARLDELETKLQAHGLIA